MTGENKVEIFEEVLESSKLTGFQHLPFLWSGQTDNPSFVWQQLFTNPAFAMTVYDDMEEKTGSISSNLETRINGTLSKTWRIKPASESREDRKIAEFVEDTFRNYGNFNGILEEALQAVYKGVSIGEKIYADGGDRVYIEKIKFHPQYYFSFGDGEFAQFSNTMIWRQTGPLRLREGVTLDAISGQVLDENKFFVFTYRPRYGNRWGTPLARKLYWAGWFLRSSAKQWLKYLEKGTGAVVARYNDGAAQAEQDNALGAAQAIVEESAVAIPKKFLLEVHEMVRSVGSSHREFVDNYCKSDITQIILGQTLTSRGSDGGGSRALGEVHERVQADRIEVDCIQLMQAINAPRSIVDNTVFYNFGPGKKRPVFEIEYESKEDLDALAKRLTTLKDLGLPLSKSSIYKTFQVSPPQGKDDKLDAGKQAETPEEESKEFSEFAEKKKIMLDSHDKLNSKTERFRKLRPSMIRFSDE